MEEWRDVPNTNGLYQISISTKEGQCRSLRFNKVKILSNNRKERAQWCINGKKQQAARWIAMTYPEMVQNAYFEGAEIDHIDTDPRNNHPSNLRWVDRSGQMLNSLTNQHLRQSNTNNSKTSKKVVQLTLNGDIVKVYPSVQEVQRQNGFDAGSISRCCNGKLYKTVGGYKWQWN